VVWFGKTAVSKRQWDSRRRRFRKDCGFEETVGFEKTLNFEKKY